MEISILTYCKCISQGYINTIKVTQDIKERKKKEIINLGYEKKKEKKKDTLNKFRV